jgi:DNA-binding CsgD family transcriptional regulator
LVWRSAEAGEARELEITPRTVNKHVENIYRKLGVTGRRQAIAVAFDGGSVA